MSTPYNPLEAYRAEKYVSKRYSHLSNTAIHIYFGLKFLEEKHKGFCHPVIADYRSIARVSHVGKNAVGDGLRRLIETGLIKCEIGSSDKGDKKATILTRVSVDDLRRNSPDKNGIAQRLADVLNTRPFMFNGNKTQPLWGVGITGRLTASKPAFQNEPKDKRINGLRLDMPSDCMLFDSDIRSAEPTVIKHILKMSQDVDLYACYMRATECDRRTAKTEVNRLNYDRNSQNKFKYWPEAARNEPVLSNYVKKLHDYKTNLFEQSKKTRSVTTLTGRPIAGEKGKKLHAGHYFNRRVQGTVADIVNAAALELIEMPGVKTLVPMHDAFYVVCTDGMKETIEAGLHRQAKKSGIQIQIKTVCKGPL